MAEHVHLAANNADLGGGEQMLIRTAEALLALGHGVTVVAPDTTHEVLDAAAATGAGTVAIRADDRRDYLRRLRAWDRHERSGLLWCHGLVPALATAGRPDRIVHLHQLPRTRAQHAALGVVRHGAVRLLVPSRFLAAQVTGATVFPNWTDDIAMLPPHLTGQESRVGFLGRLSTIKGLDVLAHAVSHLAQRETVQLVVAGDDRWVPVAESTPVTAALAGIDPAVLMLGHVTPPVFFGHVDLAVFPSRVAESFGLVVAEAMGSGVPFVISDAGALPEVAGPDHPWVARTGDAGDLARVLAEALAARPAAIVETTTCARRRWETEYSSAAGRQRVLHVLEELGVR